MSILLLVALAAQAGRGIDWLGDLKQAQFEARQTAKPMFVVFR